MRKEWILTDEEKRLKRRKIERNRLLKEQAQVALRQQTQPTNFRTNPPSSSMTEVGSTKQISSRPKNSSTHPSLT